MFVAVLLFLVFIVIYFFGISPVAFGGDSANIILSYYFGSAAHPPGYPLNTLLGFIFTRIVPGSSFVFKANSVAVFYQAITLSFLYLVLARLIKNWLISLASVSILGLTVLFWLYAHVAEVFQLSLVLVTASLFFLFSWYFINRKKESFRNLWLAVVFLGLAVFHHHLNILLIPSYLYLIFKKKESLRKVPKAYLMLFGGFMMGFLPYIYVLAVDFLGIPTNWGDLSTVGGFLRLLTRADYGTFTASPELVGFSLMARIVQLLWYFKTVIADFTVFGLILALIGAIWLFIKNKQLFVFFFSAFFFLGPFFTAYASFPPFGEFLQGVSERFFLPSYIFLTIFLAYGIYCVYFILSKFLDTNFKKAQLAKIAILGAFLLLPFYLGIINWLKTDLSDFEIGRTLALDILNSANPPGIIFLQGDTATFNTQYYYYVEKIGSESQIVMTGKLQRPYYRKKLKNEYSQLNFSENFVDSKTFSYPKELIELVELNYKDRPIYSLERLPVSDAYVWVQQGMLARLYKKDEVPQAGKIREKIDRIFRNFTFSKNLTENRYRNFFEDNIIGQYAKSYTQNALELFRRNEIDKAIVYYNLALSLDGQDKQALWGLGASYLENKMCDQSLATFEKLVKLDSEYWQGWLGLSKVYGVCFGDTRKADEYREKAGKLMNKRYDKPIEEL